MATVRELLAKYRAKAESIREELRFKGCATGEELETYWPGGSENPGRDVDAWIYCYASMVRFCDRLDDARAAGPQVDQAQAISDALADTPESVQLSSGESVAVYPKSYTALRFIGNCKRRIQWLAAKREELSKNVTAYDFSLIERAEEQIAFQFGLMVWAATYQPAGLPFPVYEAPHELPEHIQQWSPSDYVLVRMAFERVNAVRLFILTTALRGKQKSEETSEHDWETFFSIRSEEMHVPSAILMNDRSLASQLAAAILAGDAREKARDRAEAEHQAKAAA